MEQVNFVAPQGGGGSKKLENIKKIDPGMQLGILYGMYDIGTQETKLHGAKPKVVLTFEFPLHQRVFYEGEEAKPKVLSCTETFSMYKNARLRKYITEMTGAQMSDDQANKYNFTELLGLPVIVNIIHSACGKYENITSFSPLYDQNCLMYGLQDRTQAAALRTNDIGFFHISQKFEHTNFGMLPKWIREKAISSHEGKAHALAGGTFYEKPKTESGNMKLVLNDPNQTVEAFLSAGWTEQQIVDQGHGKWMESTPPPVAAAPVAPAPVMQAPAPAQQVGPMFTMIATDFTEEQYIAVGHTRESLIAAGLAKMVTPQPVVQAQPVAPQFPPAPAQPVAPVQPQAPAPVTPNVMMAPVPGSPLPTMQDNLAGSVATTPLAPAPTSTIPVAPVVPAAVNTASGYSPPINGGDDHDDLPF